MVALGRHHKVCWWRRFLLLLQTELRHFTKRSFPHVAKTTKDHFDWLPLYWTPGFYVYIRRCGEYWLNGTDISNGHFVWIHKPFVFTSIKDILWMGYSLCTAGFTKIFQNVRTYMYMFNWYKYKKDIKKITHVFFYLKKEIPQRMQNRYIDIVQDILISKDSYLGKLL